MIVHKTNRELKRAGYPKVTARLRRIACVVCMAAVLVRADFYLLPAQAAPATLKSPDATVYEQTDEGSSAVGNLVEGSTFEYIGDVTAEDGSVWHQITTANGANGYIRGDRELELREEEAVPDGQEGQGEPEGQNVPAEEGRDTAPAENEPEAGEGADENTGEEAGETGGEAPEGDGDGAMPEEGDGEDEEGLEDGDDAIAAISMQNGQTKKYVMDTSAKVKERGSFAEVNTGIQSVESKKAGLDMTLAISIAVVLFCIEAINISLSRMRRLRGGMAADEILDPGKGRNQRKIEKKKRSQKRKARKASQGRRESIKTSNTRITKEK